MAAYLVQAPGPVRASSVIGSRGAILALQYGAPDDRVDAIPHGGEVFEAAGDKP
ncbi:MAG: hypothetical protein WD076_11180 [Parvularculaceae bacterium]